MQPGKNYTGTAARLPPVAHRQMQGAHVAYPGVAAGVEPEGVVTERSEVAGVDVWNSGGSGRGSGGS